MDSLPPTSLEIDCAGQREGVEEAVAPEAVAHARRHAVDGRAGALRRLDGDAEAAVAARVEDPDDRLVPAGGPAGQGDGLDRRAERRQDAARDRDLAPARGHRVDDHPAAELEVDRALL